jgi:hypothetical protein
MKRVRITIPQDARVADIVDGLRDPIEYVRRVILSLGIFGARKDNDDYLAVLSLQSDPSASDYQIIEIMEREPPRAATLEEFSGRTHKPLSYDKPAPIHWSSEGSTFSELQQLIGKLRADAKLLR